MYTRIAPLKCICYNLVCSNQKCEISYQEAAEEKGIFFYSTKTAVADEVGWDFVRAVKNVRTSFRGFCKEMSTKYETGHSLAYPFLSGNTFISYFFCWLAAMKIDFRKEIDPKCGYDPQILACDGTHIGVSTRNLKLDEPVTKPDFENVLKSKHRRKQRALIPDCDARKNLKYFCKKVLKKLKEDKEKDRAEELYMKQYLLQEVEQMQDETLSRGINLFFSEQLPQGVHVTYAKFLIMLAGDSPMSSVLPFRSHQVIRDIIQSMVTTRTLCPKVVELKKYSCELRHLFQAAIQTNIIGVIVSFVLQLINRIEYLHNTKNRPTPDIEEIPNSYNPSKGIAYYFTPSGNQIRKMPGYEEVGGKKNYDDPQKLMVHARKIIQVYHMEDLGTYFYGSVQYMVIVMVSISSLEGKEERIPFLHCSSTSLKHQKNCSMTMPVNYMNIASTESLHGFWTHSSGMTYSILLATYADVTTNQGESLGLRH